MCEDHSGSAAHPAAQRAHGISRRGMLAGVGAGFSLALVAAAGTASANSGAPGAESGFDADGADGIGVLALNGAWCNPTQGTFPAGGHFGAPRGSGSHAGQDISNSSGTFVYAAAAGTVIRRGVAVLPGRTGNGIVIQHAGGLFTYYGHLNAFRVNLNARVSAGQRIGDMGTTGNVTGPHLHFETHSGSLGNAVNPVPFATARGVNLQRGWSSINPGASGQRVRVIQHLLNQRGANLAVDGDYGSVSSGAVRTFQSGNGLVADGQVGPLTWQKLVYSLQQGASGHHVRALQAGLNKRSAGLAVDGGFGAVTNTAVRTFQSGNRLAVDGLAGPVTWRAIVG
ncbi:peptidoglycan-binding protein [Streptomyces profundus]|uniref:peptidoglycan-binding protein n=1 Tax=Streptomyces profundus TaxID=2867410 RepID=UPI001D15FFD6|nr:peptidoglycan-binding protein [Streptomyces sp. MA3_2.13]UED87245.1 peptidoglycan DD-metalloendopeptidase family protein [Streptomyces sp. MA3_2.13]